MSKCWTISVSLLVVASCLALPAQPSALDEGVRLIREHRFEQALTELQRAHRMAPKNATIENLLGLVEMQLGHSEEACNHYRNAIALDATQAAPHKNLGFNLLTAKNYAEAEPELREASRLDPSDPFAHYYLMLLALATGRDAEAVEQAAHAGPLVDNDPAAAADLIEAEIRLGRVEDAASSVERLEVAGRLDAVREYKIAILLNRHAAYRQAIHCFRRIALLDPSWQSRYNLGLALLYGGEAAEASAVLARLHEEQPANADILMFLGSAYEAQQKMPEALEAYRAAAAADPTNPDRTLDYTRLLMDLDRYDEALHVVQSGMESTHAVGPLQLRLGAVEMLKSNYPAAREAFRAALAADPQSDTAYVGLAQTYAREANDAEAFRVLEDARAKLPGHYLLEYYFGMLASRLGREQEAIAALERATQLEPNSPDPLYELGKLRVARQEWPQAREALERAIALNPAIVSAHYQLSSVYVRLGMKEKAEEEARQTHTLVESQREAALRRQRERGGSFQPQNAAEPVRTN